MPRATGDLGRSLHTEAKRNAKRREIPYSLTLQDVRSLVAQANGRCQLTGIAFTEEIVNGSRTKPYRPTIDRIDNSHGYHPDNVRLVCVAVNAAMREWGRDGHLQDHRCRRLPDAGVSGC